MEMQPNQILLSGADAFWLGFSLKAISTGSLVLSSADPAAAFAVNAMRAWLRGVFPVTRLNAVTNALSDR